ncbi:hypothetical protein IWW36_001457 [Coemansia brasiliensis]|uniref:Phytanoyl-CoA dioxygenase n=1 Tax=Coemansia brasiliensis TaxID=2650707 RepID=A0A9W8I8Y3_9FUNG|nr:hypothetical protein IWW36_001457 [Coemansia brasiliensis]
MLSNTSVEQFSRQGFTVVPDFLTQEEIDMFTKEAQTLVNFCYEQGDIVAQWGCVIEPLNCDFVDSTQEAKTSRSAFLNLRAQISSRSLAQCILDKFGLYAQRLLEHKNAGDEPVVLLNDQYIVKPPHTDAKFGWHQDELYFTPEQRKHRMVSIWVPLCNISSDNGPVLIDPYPDPECPGVYPSATSSVTQICAAMSAGSALFMDGRVRHCSTDNKSSQFRIAYMPQFSLGAIASNNGLAALAVPID